MSRPSSAIVVACSAIVISGLIFSSSPSSSSLSSEGPSAKWNPDVLRLFSLDQRDEALRRLLEQGRYSPDPHYREEVTGTIKDVVICPQPGQRTLVTVFVRSKFSPEDESPRSGHFIVIRNDGAIIPFYYNANSLGGDFRDLNGDGVMDCIDSMSIGFDEYPVRALYVIPVLEEFKPSLLIYWKEDPSTWEGLLTWRLSQPQRHLLPTIQIGTEENGTFEMLAEYRWSHAEQRWTGPPGSPQQEFLVVDTDGKLGDLPTRMRLYQDATEERE